MSRITVVGGVYHERCIWPDWDHLYGSAGRAAAALSGHVEEILLSTYAREDTAALFSPYAEVYGFTFRPTTVDQTISFEYVHSFSNPVITPSIGRIQRYPTIEIEDDIVLRFGMLEGSARVSAKTCIYDPQSAFDPELFAKNGSMATRLAVVANRGEILRMGDGHELEQCAEALVGDGAEVVVVKSGAAGALVVTARGKTRVPAYRSSRVWKIGSGDVFAAMFAAAWGVRGYDAETAADIASKAVAEYSETMSLPSIAIDELFSSRKIEAVTVPGRVYLASPFFTLGQRWVVDEAREGLRALGLDVFSPVHDVGRGPADKVAPADLAAFETCDRVFAVLDGTDAGTLFEVGYARARELPVYSLAQAIGQEDLKMVTGSGGKTYDDFVTALHHTAWRT